MRRLVTGVLFYFHVDRDKQVKAIEEASGAAFHITARGYQVEHLIIHATPVSSRTSTGCSPLICVHAE